MVHPHAYIQLPAKNVLLLMLLKGRKIAGNNSKIKHKSETAIHPSEDFLTACGFEGGKVEILFMLALDLAERKKTPSAKG